MHLHLDLVGGLSGDMFIGALLDCFPEHRDSLNSQLVSAGFPDLVKLEIVAADDGILTGTQVHVIADRDAESHHHRHYRDIVSIIESSQLETSTQQTALDIFRIIAEAEAAIHGKPVSDIAFHEVGAWDSIADIVCASWLINAVGAESWSVSSVPLGSGRVNTAHGLLPVPAPATVLILRGFDCHDDGIPGERVTPTGAAILRHLQPQQTRMGAQGRLSRTGYGFGSKRFEGISNVTRVVAFEANESSAPLPWETDQVLVLEFEIDDQTPEDIAVAIAHLSALPAVIDIAQAPVYVKKGRMATSLRILASPAAENKVLAACFAETTTLGVRKQVMARAVLRRESLDVEYDADGFNIKTADRPGGQTHKVDIDDLARHGGNHRQRQQLRQTLERNRNKHDEQP